MCWAPRGDIQDERAIVVGHSSGLLRLWALPAPKVTTGPDAPLKEIATGAGAVVKVHSLPLLKDGNGRVVSSHDKGKLCLWDLDAKGKPVVWEVGGPIDASALSHDGATVAIGGREKELQMWSVENRKSIFTARNRPDDKLGLRCPIWVAAMAFFPGESHKILTATGHREIRVYDIRQGKRPVQEWKVHTHTGESLKMVRGPDHEHGAGWRQKIHFRVHVG
jgi:WD40 repeat protein